VRTRQEELVYSPPRRANFFSWAWVWPLRVTFRLAVLKGVRAVSVTAKPRDVADFGECELAPNARVRWRGGLDGCVGRCSAGWGDASSEHRLSASQEKSVTDGLGLRSCPAPPQQDRQAVGHQEQRARLWNSGTCRCQDCLPSWCCVSTERSSRAAIETQDCKSTCPSGIGRGKQGQASKRIEKRERKSIWKKSRGRRIVCRAYEEGNVCSQRDVRQIFIKERRIC
jgi:hypothetical protein